MDATVNVEDGISQAFVPLGITESTRYPHAYAAESPDGWAVYLFDGESVVPKNLVVAYPELGEELSRPRRLETTAEDAYESLLAAVLFPQTTEAVAHALADHCKQHPADLVFCRAHGLPVDHLSPEEYIKGPWLPQMRCEPAEILRVTDIEQMMTAFMAIEDIAERTTNRRTPALRSEVHDALAWPVLAHDAREFIERQIDQKGKLPVGVSRWLVKQTVDALFRQTRTEFGYYWLPQYGLRLVCMTRTDLGIYAAAFMSRILQAASVGTKPLLDICASCGDAFQPRSSQQQYCTKPACRRAHAARNKRRERERASGLNRQNGENQ